MFKDHGLTVEQVTRAIFRNPNILTHSANDLKPTFEYLRRLGIAEKDVSYIVSHHPKILTSRLEETLAPKIALLARYLTYHVLFNALQFKSNYILSRN